MALQPYGDYSYNYNFNPVAMATKEVHFYKNGGAPFITVASLPPPPEPEPKDVHYYHYYGNTPSNGYFNSPQTPRAPMPTSAAREPARKQESYVIIGTIEYGRLIGIDAQRSTPGVSGIPTKIATELMSVYAHIPNAVVIIMNNAGQFTIQTQLVGTQPTFDAYQNGHMPPPAINGAYNMPPLAIQGVPQMNQMNQMLPAPMNQIQSYQPQVQQQPPPQVQQQPPPRQIIIYTPPKQQKPRQRRQPRDDESIVSYDDDDDGFSSEEDDRRRRGRDDGKSHLQRKYSDLYREERKGRRGDRSGREDGRRRNDRSDREEKREEKRSARGVYRIHKGDERRRTGLQDRTLGTHTKDNL